MMTGAAAIAFWRKNGLLGTFSDREEDSPELARKMREEANLRGYGKYKGIAPSVDEFLKHKQEELAKERSAEERAASFRAWAKSNRTDTPPLSDEATRRESIYADTEEWEREFIEWTDSHSKEHPILPPDAFERESLYDDDEKTL